jgi:hypothetical protein
MILGGFVGFFGVAAEYGVDNLLVLPVGMLKVGYQKGYTVQKVGHPGAHVGDCGGQAGDPVTSTDNAVPIALSGTVSSADSRGYQPRFA